MSANNATSGATGTAEVPVQANNPINLAADEATNDTSSEIGGSVASSTASLSDSIRDFRVENGRTYHKYKDGRYHAPNDERENERLDLQHHLCLLTLDNRLGLAPANDPDSKVTRVLDVGTGTGIWAEDFGEEHPNAEVIGFDLSPTMSDLSVPPNVKFEVDDLDEEWNWSQPFDYIHSRFMNASIGNWKTFATKVFKCTELLGEAAGIFGRPYQEIPPLVKVLEDAGFVDVKMEVHKWPTNDWPKYPEYKELGIWANENFIAGFESFTMAPLTRAHGWTKEEVQVFLVEVRKDLGNRSIHAYWPMYNIYGRKPSEKQS
ncbi:Secondary metabolism regulator LAE1 [Colletotrichum sp. SAR 10_77]|nr:Secondary metabolism regulator LAE1 [Colletotrichum sp. SAR 10_77]KAJ5003527.1 Secondary metabolism regulator LAE1 [Colletotrichum sp. SAR 10_66]